MSLFSPSLESQNIKDFDKFGERAKHQHRLRDAKCQVRKQKVKEDQRRPSQISESDWKC